MPRLRLFWPASLVLIGTLPIAALSRADDGEPPATSAPAVTTPGPESTYTAKGQRVIVHVNRLTSVYGHIELEDDTIMVVRKLDGELAHFSKSRVMQLQRLVDAAPDRKAYVFLVSGEVVEGTLISDGFEEVILEVHGVRSHFRRTSVSRVELEPTFDEQYENFLASINENQPHRHLQLCVWLIDHRRYELARHELLRLIEINDIPEARALLQTVEAQLSLIAMRSEKPARRTRADEDDDRPRSSRGNANLPLLNEEQINLIKVYEMDFRRPPRVNLSADVVRAFMSHYAEDPRIPATPEGREALEEAPAMDIVRLMFELKARDFYPQVEVLTEPYAMATFRRNVHNTWLMNNCATSNCHGGPDGGRFRLIEHRNHVEKVRYTNFLILDRLELDPGWPLINYEQPLDSIIIQYGLPANHARRAHPDVPGWRPAFRRATDRSVLDTIKWIEAMMRPRVDYPFAFPMPWVEGDTSPVQIRPESTDQVPASAEEPPAADSDSTNGT